MDKHNFRIDFSLSPTPFSRSIFFALVIISAIPLFPSFSFAQVTLHEAAKAGDMERVRGFVTKNKGLIFTTDQWGLSPLHYAATIDVEMVKYLLDSGAIVDVTSANGTTPLYTAARYGKLDICSFLLENGANVNAVAAGGSPMHEAVYRSPVEVVKLFITHNADLTLQDQGGNTALHVAATWNAIDPLKTLIEAGANINAINYEGDTPLHACLVFAPANTTGSLEAAKILLEAGADPNILNQKGLSAADLAHEYGAYKMAALLARE